MAVVGRGGTRTAALLRALVPGPVVELTPCQAAFYEGCCRAVVVENFDPPAQRTLSGCAAARWALSGRADITVAGVWGPGGGRRGRGLSVGPLGLPPPPGSLLHRRPPRSAHDVSVAVLLSV